MTEDRTLERAVARVVVNFGSSSMGVRGRIGEQARKAFGWAHEADLDEGMRRLVAWPDRQGRGGRRRRRPRASGMPALDPPGGRRRVASAG